MGEKLKGYTFVFMGVTSSGKSTIGEAVAKSVGGKFIDGDDLHPRNNITKMSSGLPLNDDDREPWLQRINDIAYSVEQKNETMFVVCSALKRKYREIIRRDNHKVIFIHLQGDYALIFKRMQAREGHFMPIELIKSQFDALEMPGEDERDVATISIEGSVNEVINRAVVTVLNTIEV